MSGEKFESSYQASEQDNLDKYMRSLKGPWVGVPEFVTFDRDASHTKIDQLKEGIKSEISVDPKNVDADAEQSHRLIEELYDTYEGKSGNDQDYGRMFMVTRRGHMADNNVYASESAKHSPLASQKNGVSSEMRMREQFGWPPAVIETYTKSSAKNERGAVLLAPLYADMEFLLSREEQMKVGAIALRETVKLAQQLGAEVVGLGALLPKITKFGSLIKYLDLPDLDKLTTTTGHGGTVHLIVETAKQAREAIDLEEGENIGVVGAAGSIGWSSISTILDQMPGHGVEAFDVRQEVLNEKIYTNNAESMVKPGNSLIDVLNNNRLIVSAVTDVIDLDKEEQTHDTLIDLNGKIIIDDSQPGCFDREQVEIRGGRLLWVAGRDESANRFMTRDGKYTGEPYNYGDESGLYLPDTEFGCGLEAGVIAWSGRKDLAITGPVTPENVRDIGKLFKDAGVGVAAPQSFGRPA